MSLGRVIAVILGVFLIFTSIGLLVGGVALVVVNEALADEEGYISSPAYTITNTESVAVVLQTTDLDFRNPKESFTFSFNPGDFVKIRIRATGMFVGIGSGASVSTYLSGVKYLAITEIDFDSIETTLVNSAATANLSTNPPLNALSWYASGINEVIWEPTLAQLQDQSISVVIMNANGSPGITTDVSAGAQIPILTGIGVGLLLFGIILFVFAIVLFVVAAKARPHPRVERLRVYRDPVAPIRKENLLYCSNCGGKTDVDSRFCSSCGEPVFVEGVPSPKAAAMEPQTTVTAQVQTSSAGPVVAARQFTTKDLLPVTRPDLPLGAFVVADWGTRFWAWLIDFIIINAVLESVRWTALVLTQNWRWASDLGFYGFGFSLNTIVFLLYWGLAEAKYGTTLGKQALGLVVVSEATGKVPTFGEAFISAVGKAFLIPIDVAIGVWFIKDPPPGRQISLNQRLFQRISRTVTVFRPPTNASPAANFLSSSLVKKP